MNKVEFIEICYRLLHNSDNTLDTLSSIDRELFYMMLRDNPKLVGDMLEHKPSLFKYFVEGEVFNNVTNAMWITIINDELIRNYPKQIKKALQKFNGDDIYCLIREGKVQNSLHFLQNFNYKLDSINIIYILREFPHTHPYFGHCITRIYPQNLKDLLIKYPNFFYYLDINQILNKYILDACEESSILKDYVLLRLNKQKTSNEETT